MYLPFGRGPRRCIGSRLALHEIKAAVVLFLQRYRAVPMIPAALPLRGLFAIRSTAGLPCRIERA